MHPLFHPLYIEFCCYFNGNQDYFECHEVLEEYWKEIAPGERQHPLVGYIQIATGMYHWRRGNTLGAERMLQKGANILSNAKETLFVEKINLIDYLINIEHALDCIQQGKPFQSFPLSITDEKLQQLVDIQIANTPSVDKHFLFNKHMLRNRQEIIALRQHNLNTRNQT